MAKKDKKEKKEEEVEMEVETPKKSKKDKKRKAAEAEEEVEAPKSEKKKKKKDKKEAESEDEAPKSEKKKKDKKKKKAESEDEEEEEAPKKEKKKKDKKKKEESEDEEEEETLVIKNKDTKAAEAVAACTSTKAFVMNLSWQIDEDTLKAALEPKTGKIVSVKWMEDRETGKFKGSGIVEFESTEAAGKCVQLSELEEVMGRPIRVRMWEEKGGNDRKPKREMSARPDNCTTIFCGNLDYNIDDDKMVEFFKDVAEIKQVRWLTDKTSGDFRGCGFVEFYDSESVDKAVLKNGENLLGRGIRIDYSAPKPKREF